MSSATHRCSMLWEGRILGNEALGQPRNGKYQGLNKALKPVSSRRWSYGAVVHSRGKALFAIALILSEAVGHF